MFGALIFLGVVGISAAKASYDNYEMKKTSKRIDENGNVRYYDRLCRDHINGERVQRVTSLDPDGVTLYNTVGVKTGKVYDTSYGRNFHNLMKFSEDDKQMSIKFGKNAYTQWNPYFERLVTTEISSGRTITCLWAGYNHITKENFYRKWYFRPECQGKFDYNKTVEGDTGIEITEEEYKKLKISAPSYISSPSDSEVKEKLNRWYESLDLRAEQKRKEKEEANK